jgi:hypothetical protein
MALLTFIATVSSHEFQVAVSLLIAVFACATVHRVAVTTCLLFSALALYVLNGISQSRYASHTTNVNVVKKKK